MTTHLRIGAAAAVAALVLSGCSIPLPETPDVPELQHHGNLYATQTDRIIAETLAEIAAADAEPKGEILGDRVGGDAKTVRAAEYVIKAGGGPAPTQFPESFLGIYATAEDEWPRVFVGVSEVPAAGATPMVMVWVQDDVTSDYQLRYWSHMLPGAVLPAMADQVRGAEMLPLDAEGLAMTPAAAIELYTTILTEGTDGEHGDQFAPDAYRERMFSARDSLAKTAKKRNGEYTDIIDARVDEAFAMRSDEGGALVFVPITVTSVFNVPGAQLKLPAKDRALLEGKLKDQVVHVYSDLLVISIPAAGNSVLPAVVAADHHLIAVTLKPQKPKADGDEGTDSQEAEDEGKDDS